MPRADFFFDAGSGGALWISEPAAWEVWGYPIEPGRLPVSEPLQRAVADLVARYDASLNWDYPPDPGPWRQAECDRFNARVRDIIDRLRAELGSQWQVVDRFDELREDPDLDRYLADPEGFRR